MFEKWRTAATNHDSDIPLGVDTLYLEGEFELHPDDLLFTKSKKEWDRLRLENAALQKDIVQAATSLEHLQKERADAATAKKAEEAKVLDAEKKIKDLKSINFSIHKDLEAMKKDRDDATLQVTEVARNAVDISTDAFQNCLNQGFCLYPKVDLDPQIFRFEHKIRDGKIIKFHANKTDFDVIAPSSP